MAKLRERHQRFVDEYLIDLNGTQAAIRAGYSAKTANEQASRLLANVSIQQAISERMAERSRRTGINQDRVIMELAKIALVNMQDVVNMEDVTVLPDAAREDTAAIQSVKVKKTVSDNMTIEEREIKMADKTRALELLMRHLGMFQSNINVNMENTGKLDAILSQIGGEGLEE